MFHKPKNQTLADMVVIDKPSKARRAAAALKRRFRRMRSRKAKVETKKATVNAANIAGAMLEKKNLSSKERVEMRKVRKIYRDAEKQMKLKDKD